ncbi:hypothetical protein N8684_00785 [bacterium]|jgi:hypothetical protein|nr:hypothetical protein [Bacteroidota bacterium]MDA7625772.1 hypothetical protein [bacterium]MDF1868681.1 hypothetical protein [Saprospiraceae bacterium]
MGEPPIYLQAILHTIESTTISIWEEFRLLKDKDVEYAYGKLKEFFQKKAQGKSIEEPLSSIERRQILMDEILNMLEAREEMEADSHFINNPDIAPNGIPIASLPALYVMGFNRLIKSVRFWRKEFGEQGYLGYVSKFV